MEVDSNDLVELYGKLAVYLTRTWTNQYEQDDLTSIAYFGMWKAFRNYSDTNIEFATFMGMVVGNELRTYHRDQNSAKRKGDCVSLNHIIEDEEGKKTELSQIIPSDVNIENEITERDLFNRSFRAGLKSTGKFKERDNKIVDLYFKHDLQQKQIAKMFNMTQSHVSRILKSATKEMRSYYLESII